KIDVSTLEADPMALPFQHHPDQEPRIDAIQALKINERADRCRGAVAQLLCQWGKSNSEACYPSTWFGTAEAFRLGWAGSGKSHGPDREDQPDYSDSQCLHLHDTSPLSRGEAIHHSSGRYPQRPGLYDSFPSTQSIYRRCTFVL